MATYASLKYDFGAQLTGEIPTAAIADDAVTLAKMASGTDGNLITYDASGNPAVVATGSAAQVLTSAGAGAPPTMSAAGGGAWVLITTQTVTSSVATVDFTTGIDFTGDYLTYVFVIENAVPVSDSQQFTMSFGGSNGFIGGSETATGAYKYHLASYRPNQGSETVAGAFSRSPAADAMWISGDAGAGGRMSNEGSYNAIIYINDNSTDGRFRPNMHGSFSGRDVSGNDASGGIMSGGFRDFSVRVTKVRFETTSSNLDKGTFSMYGISRS